METVPRKTTIREVAQAASVGIGTISRVLNSSSQVSRETRARVLESIRMPFVAFSNNVVGTGDEQPFDQVGFDDFNGTLHATRYLIGMGHRHIVFAGDISYPWLHHRFDGYRQGMRENKLKSVLIKVPAPQSFVDFGQKSGVKNLYPRPPPPASATGNDEIRHRPLPALRPPSLKWPDHLPLLG